MGFCSNCGNELQDGANFCPKCGATVIGNVRSNDEMSSDSKNEPETMIQSKDEKQLDGIDKYGRFLGIMLFVMAIICCFTDPAVVTIILALLIIAGSIFGLAKKYRLKGFSIAALVLSAICLLAGLGQAKKEGLFTIPGKDNESVTVAENNRITSSDETTKGISKKTQTESSSGPKTSLFAGPKSAKNKDDTKEAEERKQSESSENVKPTEAMPEEKPTETPQEEKKTETGVDPDLKAFLDSYEAFVDEYVDFMKKYSSDPSNSLSMISEYSEIMNKYADFADKIDKYNSKEMSTEDAKYYLEVTTRCSQKMLDIYGN